MNAPRATQVPVSTTSRRRKAASVVALLGMTVSCVVGVEAAGMGAASAARSKSADTGWVAPYSGTPRFEKYSPVELTRDKQLNEPIGRKAADKIAVQLGLDPKKVFTQRQFRLFITGRGVNGDPAVAKTIDEAIRILNNTDGHPLYSNVNGTIIESTLASYGLMVNTEGLLQSPANASAPTRQVNAFFEPGGYMTTWMRDNHATRSLDALYASAYTSEAVYSLQAQGDAGEAQLVTNVKGSRTSVVGMSMVPPLWIVNFCLIYTLSPDLAANMPAKWAPIPQPVADAIAASEHGQVPFSDYASFFPGLWKPVKKLPRVKDLR